MAALAGNSGCEPAVAVEPVPACHAGGRGLESRRSRKSPCKSAYPVVRPDAESRPTTHTFNRVDTKRPKSGRNPVWEPRSQADFGGGKVRGEGGVRLHEMAGGQGSAKRLPSDSTRTTLARACN